MLTPPPGLCDEDLVRVIEQAWGIAAATLEYRPVGFGSHHWLATDNVGRRHFVTVDKLNSDSRPGEEISVLGLHLRPALEAAIDLRDFGCRFVVAPITTRTDNPFVQFDGHAVALYPFVEGQSFSFEESFGEGDRDQLLASVVALHNVPTRSIRTPAFDEFAIPRLDQLEGFMQHGEEGEANGPYAVAASQLLIDNEGQISSLIAQYQSLVIRQRRDPGPLVITHGEIHPGNVMRTPTGWMIVDWDTLLIAPPERDLWRLAQSGDAVLRDYADATGTTPKERLVDLYGVRWDLAEIASFAAEFRRPHQDTEDSRKALEILRSVLGRLRT